MTARQSGRVEAPGLNWTIPIKLLPSALLEPRSAGAAILTGWLTAFVPSVVLASAVVGLTPRAAQPQLEVDGAYMLALIVVFAPIVETLIMGAALMLLLRFVGPTGAVLASAAGWGIAHSLAAPAWGLVIWWPFLVFSTLFVTWSRRSVLAGLAVASATHALQNLVPGVLLLLDLRA